MPAIQNQKALWRK